MNFSSVHPSISLNRYGNQSFQPQFGKLLGKKKAEGDTVQSKPAKPKKEKTPSGYKMAVARKSKWSKGAAGFFIALAGLGSFAQGLGNTNIADHSSQVTDINHIQAQFDDFERRADVIRDSSFLSSDNNAGELTKGLRSDFYFAMNSIFQSVQKYGDANINENDFDKVLALLDDGALSEEEVVLTNQILKDAIENDYIGDYNKVFTEWYTDVADNRITSVRDRAELRREVQNVLNEMETRKQWDDTADKVTDVSALLSAIFVTANLLPSRKLKKLEADRAAGKPETV